MYDSIKSIQYNNNALWLKLWLLRIEVYRNIDAIYKHIFCDIVQIKWIYCKIRNFGTKSEGLPVCPLKI